MKIKIYKLLFLILFLVIKTEASCLSQLKNFSKYKELTIIKKNVNYTSEMKNSLNKFEDDIWEAQAKHKKIGQLHMMRRTRSLNDNDLNRVGTKKELSDFKHWLTVRQTSNTISSLISMRPEVLKFFDLKKFEGDAALSYAKNFFNRHFKSNRTPGQARRILKELKSVSDSPSDFNYLLINSLYEGSIREREATILLKKLNLYKEYRLKLKYYSTLSHYQFKYSSGAFLTKPIDVDKDWENLTFDIEKFLTSPEKVYKRLEEFNKEYEALLEKKSHSPEKAIIAIFAKWEKIGGFNKAFDLPPKFYTTTEWLEKAVKPRALFNDTTFREGMGNFTQHGQYAHRIQWNFVIREMQSHESIIRNRISGKRVSAADIKEKFGEVEFNKKWFGNYKKFPNQIWARLFDTGPSDLTNPYLASSIFNRSLKRLKFFQGVNTFMENKN